MRTAAAVVITVSAVAVVMVVLTIADMAEYAHRSLIHTPKI